MRCIADVGAILGEGPVWVGREAALYWVDIVAGTLFRWSEQDGASTIAVARPLCSIVPRAGGGFVGGSYEGFVGVDEQYRLTLIANPEPDRPVNRMNDGKTDREGRFWAGTMDRHEQAASGALYRLDPDRTWTRIDDGYRVTNGPAFSPDGRTLYHSDSALQRIYSFDLAADGTVSNKRLFAQFGEGEGYPDGMTVDAEGCLWVAFWGGWCVRRLAPDGAVLASIAVPTQCPTSCAFGGEALDQLFITSAARDLDAQERLAQPTAGGLFVTRPGVCGIAERPYAG